MSGPVVLYICSGKLFVTYTLWSIASLDRYGYKAIEVIAGHEKEKALINQFFPEIVCRVMKADMKGYPAFSYKPFVLRESFQSHGLPQGEGDIVVCDADVIWKADPRPLFERFSGRHWFHKITSVNPADFDKNLCDVPRSNIGLITSLHFKNRYGLDVYPDFRLNAGLFMAPRTAFRDAIETWMTKILRLSPEEMLMSEALLSHVYAEKGWVPESDDVKYFGMRQDPVKGPVFSCRKTEPPSGALTGYQTAKHYYSDQRKEMFTAVKEQGLDDRLGLLKEARSLSLIHI